MQPLATALLPSMAGQTNTWPIVRRRLFGTGFKMLALAVVIALAGALVGQVTVSAEPAEPGGPNGPVQVIEGPVMITDTIPLEPEDPCSVSGLIGANVTWSPATCNPYIMTGSILVLSSATLTIAPGTRVEVTSLKGLTVQGTLVARGVDGTPIVFTSNAASPGKGDWGYIHFADSSTDATVDANGNYVSGSILQYATVEYAGGASINDNGAVRIEASSPYIDHNTIRLNKTDGIHAWSNGAPYLFNNQVLNNGIPGSTSANGIYVDSTGTTTIKANTVQGNTSTGIAMNYGTPALRDNTVTSNGYYGILVSNAVATISNNTVNNNSQGGISFSGSAFTIDNNHVNSNSGTGIYVYGTGNISANTVTNNTGGGISHNGTGDVVANTVTGNTSTHGAGVYFASTGNILNNSITNNTAGSYGGGIWAIYNGGGQISNNTIANNSAGNRGGGIYVYSSVAILNNAIIGNSAPAGGAIYSIYNPSFGCSGAITGNDINNNQAAQNHNGGGIYLENGCRPNINDNDIYGNSAGSPSLLNDIFNGNQVGFDLNAQNNYWGTTDSNVIEEHVWHFIDDSSLSIVNYYPFRAEPVTTPDFDLDDNGVVDVLDVVVIAGEWGATDASALLLYDFNHNSIVDIGDIMLVAGHFGPVAQ